MQRIFSNASKQDTAPGEKSASTPTESPARIPAASRWLSHCS